MKSATGPLWPLLVALVSGVVAHGSAESSSDPTGLLTLSPLWLPESILEPDSLSMVRFSVSGAPKPAQLTFRGQDYRRTVPNGGWPVTAAVSSNGTATLTLTHSVGYYEYTCEQTNQTFGIVVAPKLPEPVDERFAVLAGFTQICNTVPVSLREPLLAMLARVGVRHYRDFPQQGQLRANASAPYNWDHVDPAGLAGRMEQLHQLNRQYNVRVLDCFGGSLSWNERADWFDGRGAPWRWPKNLSVAADTFEAIAAHWGDTEGGIEADNEMDAAPYTADQYSVLLKAMRYGLFKAQSSGSVSLPPLVCGAFTDAVHSAYLELLGRNQVFEVCDVISYHTYCDPATVQDDVGRVRLWQQEWNATSTPLYITESGADFALRWNSTDESGNPHGRPRPTLAQGRAYAFGNVAHQIENIASGVDRTYAFNYLYYAEGGQNYGLTGASHTPLRAFAAYTAAVRFLQHKRYIGDLPNKVSPNGRGRVFANDDLSEIVACVFSGSWSQDEFSGEMQPETPPGPMWSWFMPITGAYEVDGSPVHFSCAPASGCQWGNYDKLSWLTLNTSVLSMLDMPTVAVRLTLHLCFIEIPILESCSECPSAPDPSISLRTLWDSKEML